MKFAYIKNITIPKNCILFLKQEKEKIVLQTGEIVKIIYHIIENDKQKIQNYQGLIISVKNLQLGQSFILRRIVDGVGVEQNFLSNSPHIEKIIKLSKIKIRRSKLYYLRKLKNKIL